MTSNAAFTPRNGLLYGLMGLPLAFAALPLYVLLPHHYASNLGVPLALLGPLLLAARLLDGVVDPLLGRWGDRLFARSPRAVLAVAAGAALLMALGFAGLFFPPVRTPQGLLLWAAALLLLTYAGYSTLGVLHQAWAALLGGSEAERGRIVAWREGLGLVGVVTASVAPVLLGLPATVGLLVLGLVGGWWAWSHSLPPSAPVAAQAAPAALWQPWRNPAFRRLLAVFLLNGIASAVPATLVLFFVQDRLQTAPTLQPLFLASYFLCAALSIPLWLKLVEHLGLARTWLVGMGLAVATFIGASLLGAGDTTAFLLVCVASGIALGTDLALPSALLAGVVKAAADARAATSLYFGWWNFATKLNLALAAGLALPLLALAGYTPGAQDAQALRALSAVYCLLPCVLKALAAAALYLLIIRPSREVSP